MTGYRRRIPGLNSEQVMHAMGIDDAYRVQRVLVRNANGVTELVTIEDAGPFVRKKMPLQSANRAVWAALAGSACPRLPQVAATYEMPDWFVVVYDYVRASPLRTRSSERARLVRSLPRRSHKTCARRSRHCMLEAWCI